MRIVVQINPHVFTDPVQIAMIARGFLKGVVLQNRLLIRTKQVPKLYESGVRYKQEPWAGRFEEFADALTVYRRKWGDCDDLVAWRAAEIQEAGGMAWPKVYWRVFCENCKAQVNRAPQTCKAGGECVPGSRHFHGEVRIYERGPRGRWLPTDNVEDPSRFLGMHP